MACVSLCAAQDAEKKIIEHHFCLGTLRVLCSTTSLGEGVNLPVRRVLHAERAEFEGANQCCGSTSHLP